MIQEIEDTYHIAFGTKHPLVIERGKGVYVWDTSGKRYLDFTAGWAVTSLGHAHPVHVRTISEQVRKISQNPDSGLTYSPPRALLLERMVKVLPENLRNVFFVNSGAEANDAALKLARKITGRKKIVSTRQSFHGRTIGTTSVTGQAVQRDRYVDGLIPHCSFIDYNCMEAAEREIDTVTAAVIVEPVQSEGGVRVPDDTYLPFLARCCRKNGALLIVDEIQTGFWRTGPAFASVAQGVLPDFLTLGKGIAGGFPFGAVAVAADTALEIEPGDHGGTYCGNPLGCAVAAATVGFLDENEIGTSVEQLGNHCISQLLRMKEQFPGMIREVRGKGLLIALEFTGAETALRVHEEAREQGCILNLKHGTIMRIFPALIIKRKELEAGLEILRSAVASVAVR
jgi:acetylornithine/N-succinyldiaminopimelate aminotransferase